MTIGHLICVQMCAFYFPSPEHTEKIKRNNLQTRVELGLGGGGAGRFIMSANEVLSSLLFFPQFPISGVCLFFFFFSLRRACISSSKPFFFFSFVSFNNTRLSSKGKYANALLVFLGYSHTHTQGAKGFRV